MRDDEVYYVSEHRGSYNNHSELKNKITKKPDIVIFAISITRFNAVKAAFELEQNGIKISVVHILWIKPFKLSKIVLDNLKNSKFGGIILDDDYENGVAKSIANDLNIYSNKSLYIRSKNRSAGFHSSVDNLPPSKDEIVKKIKQIIKKMRFYYNKNILVAGGTGMVGQKLVEKLIKFGANVYCFKRQ